MRYTITKPLRELPPLTVKNIKFTGALNVDFVRKFNAICVNLNLHNHAGATATYKINDEADTMDLSATTGKEIFENCHIEVLELVSASDVDALCILAPIPLLKKYEAVESQ